MTPEQVTQQLSMLKPGSAITVEVATPAGQRIKFRSAYVGFLAKQYVLVQMPDVSKSGKNIQHIKQDTPCTIRGLIEGDSGAVVGFMTMIERTLQLPSKLIVLSFPSGIETQPLRRSIRVATEVEASIKVHDKNWHGMVKDISKSGCLFSLGSNASDILVAEGDEIVVKVTDENISNNYHFSGSICSAKIKSDSAAIGIRFDDKHQQKLLDLLEEILMMESM